MYMYIMWGDVYTCLLLEVAKAVSEEIESVPSNKIFAVVHISKFEYTCIYVNIKYVACLCTCIYNIHILCFEGIWTLYTCIIMCNTF